jgi:ankyrin repeat protein
LELVKKGDIDQVLFERNRSGIDIGTLVDDANFKQTPLFSAALVPDDSHSLQMARALKDMGVNPTQPDTLNQTTMYYASREGKNQLIDFLVENGCNVNHIDTYGQTPFFYATREGRLETLRKLVSLGADHDLIDNNG